MPRTDYLAVAFTDMNGNNKFNAGKDVLIAALVDTNNDNAVTVGDTVVWGTYPALPDGSASGTGGIYTSLSSTVTSVDFVSNNQIQVDTAGGSLLWAAGPNVEQFATFDGGLESNLVDSITLPGIDDSIFVDTSGSGPGQPNFDVDVSAPQMGDQGFLDIVFNNFLV